MPSLRGMYFVRPLRHARWVSWPPALVILGDSCQRSVAGSLDFTSVSTRWGSWSAAACLVPNPHKRLPHSNTRRRPPLGIYALQLVRARDGPELESFGLLLQNMEIRLPAAKVCDAAWASPSRLSDICGKLVVLPIAPVPYTEAMSQPWLLFITRPACPRRETGPDTLRRSSMAPPTHSQGPADDANVVLLFFPAVVHCLSARLTSCRTRLFLPLDLSTLSSNVCASGTIEELK